MGPFRIGRFLVFPPFAAGGTASVHLARMTGPLGFSRVCAVKRLHPHLAGDPEFVAMMLDEARLSARIASPHVAAVLDVVADSGELLIAMEFVRGVSLAELRRAPGQYPPPIGVAVGLAIQILRGLHAAHETIGDGGVRLRIVHRDVSPQNIVVGVDGLARVIDFGVAKAIWRAQSSRAGELKGKLAYMAPEQLRSGAVDARADVFGVGVVLWELLTGQRLFAAAGDDILATRLAGAGISLPSVVRSEIGPELDAVVGRALSEDPGARFETAAEMGRALEALGFDSAIESLGAWARAAGAREIARIETHAAAVSSASPTSWSDDSTLTTALLGEGERSEPTTTAMTSNGAGPPRGSDRATKRVALFSASLILAGIAVWSAFASRTPAAAPSASPQPTVVSRASVAVQVSSVPMVASALVSSSTLASTSAPAPKVKPKPTPSAPRPCEPPWVTDDAGIRTFKLECL